MAGQSQTMPMPIPGHGLQHEQYQPHQNASHHGQQQQHYAQAPHAYPGQGRVPQQHRPNPIMNLPFYLGFLFVPTILPDGRQRWKDIQPQMIQKDQKELSALIKNEKQVNALHKSSAVGDARKKLIDSLIEDHRRKNADADTTEWRLASINLKEVDVVSGIAKVFFKKAVTRMSVIIKRVPRKNVRDQSTSFPMRPNHINTNSFPIVHGGQHNPVQRLEQMNPYHPQQLTGQQLPFRPPPHPQQQQDQQIPLRQPPHPSQQSQQPQQQMHLRQQHAPHPQQQHNQQMPQNRPLHDERIPQFQPGGNQGGNQGGSRPSMVPLRQAAAVEVLDSDSASSVSQSDSEDTSNHRSRKSNNKKKQPKIRTRQPVIVIPNIPHRRDSKTSSRPDSYLHESDAGSHYESPITSTSGSPKPIFAGKKFSSQSKGHHHQVHQDPRKGTEILRHSRRESVGSNGSFTVRPSSRSKHHSRNQHPENTSSYRSESTANRSHGIPSSSHRRQDSDRANNYTERERRRELEQMEMNALELEHKKQNIKHLEHLLEMQRRMSQIHDPVVHQPQPVYSERSWTGRGVPERGESFRYPPGTRRDSYSGGRR